ARSSRKVGGAGGGSRPQSIAWTRRSCAHGFHPHPTRQTDLVGAPALGALGHRLEEGEVLGVEARVRQAQRGEGTPSCSRLSRTCFGTGLGACRETCWGLRLGRRRDKTRRTIAAGGGVERRRSTGRASAGLGGGNRVTGERGGSGIVSRRP